LVEEKGFIFETLESKEEAGRRKKQEEGRRRKKQEAKEEAGRRKKEEGRSRKRRKKQEEGRRKKQEAKEEAGSEGRIRILDADSAAIEVVSLFSRMPDADLVAVVEWLVIGSLRQKKGWSNDASLKKKKDWWTLHFQISDNSYLDNYNYK
ncbi:hypothetical protein Ccrd_025965, partial [Cynara cardunculus var. scolymus]